MAQARNLREKLRRIFVGTLLTALAAVVLAFGVDFTVFRIRAATNHNAYGMVTVNHYYAILQKNGKTQLIFDPPQAESCVHAIFPHSGMQPCWYLSKHTDQRTSI
ncbi:MAG: hypothetical protein ACRD3B_16080 [Candidatus Sulfotelmatobacter sp.]